MCTLCRMAEHLHKWQCDTIIDKRLNWVLKKNIQAMNLDYIIDFLFVLCSFHLIGKGVECLDLESITCYIFCTKLIFFHLWLGYLFLFNFEFRHSKFNIRCPSSWDEINISNLLNALLIMSKVYFYWSNILSFNCKIE